MSEGSLRAPEASVATGLDAHLATFLETLEAAGYVETTQQDKRWFVARFVRWVERARIETPDLDESCVSTYVGLASRRRHKRDQAQRAALHQFLEHLRSVGAVPRGHRPERSQADVLVGRYVPTYDTAAGSRAGRSSSTLRSPFLGSGVAPGVFLIFVIAGFSTALHSNHPWARCLSYVGTEGGPAAGRASTQGSSRLRCGHSCASSSSTGGRGTISR